MSRRDGATLKSDHYNRAPLKRRRHALTLLTPPVRCKFHRAAFFTSGAKHRLNDRRLKIRRRREATLAPLSTKSAAKTYGVWPL